jgi:cytochrome c oxidase assembly protein subunit 11
MSKIYSNKINYSQRKTIVWLIVLILSMFVFAFAQVQLYGLFCQTLGVNSLSARIPFNDISANNDVKPGNSNRSITIRFDATVNEGLPWSFIPVDKKINLTPGEYKQVIYKVKNLTNEVIVGQSVVSTVPWQAQSYLKKIECFCYEQQTLQAYEEKEMPVILTLSADLPEDMNSLVVSYTFLNAKKSSAKKYQQLSKNEIKTM